MRRKTTEELDVREEIWGQHFGDVYNEVKVKKNKSTESYTPFVVGTLNVHYMPERGTPSMIALQDEIKGQDVQGICEHNLNFSKVRQDDQLKERLKKTWRTEPKTVTSWIRERDHRMSEKQLGGVALATHGINSDYMRESGEDSTGLARWCWMCFEGQEEVKTVIIQIYRPVLNRANEGSVYMQQASRLAETDVLRKYDDDLLQLVDKFADDGYRVMIIGDFNTNVLNNEGFLVKGLRDRGLCERITKQHGTFGAPSTFRYGSEMIDGIFAHPELEIIRCGMCHGNPAVSDHRLVWAEFNRSSIIGDNCGEMFRPETRRVQCKYKKVVKKFNGLLVKQMVNHKLLPKAEELWRDWITSGIWDADKAARYESIDNQFTRAVRYADKKCRKLFPDAIKFSPEVRQAVGRNAIWKEIKKKVTKKERINKRWLINLKTKWGLVDEEIDIPDSLAVCTSMVASSWATFKEVKRKSPELRDHFLDLLIRENEQRGDKKGTQKAKQLRSIRSNERGREAHRRIRHASGKGQSKGIRFIHKVQEDGTTQTITDKPEMIGSIMEANSEKLHQSNADGIPLRQQPLVDLLTKFDYDVWEDFIRGDIDIPGNIEEGTKEWLKKFHKMDISNDIEMTCDHKELIAAWSTVKENTSSLPHPCHYGVMKTMKWCQMAAKFHTIMANIPLATGYSPVSWQNDVEAMLQKKDGEWRPDKLRRISLLDARFNMNNRRTGRLAMEAAEDRGLLADEQYGSRKKRSAEKHALNKRLLLDIMRKYQES